MNTDELKQTIQKQFDDLVERAIAGEIKWWMIYDLTKSACTSASITLNTGVEGWHTLYPMIFVTGSERHYRTFVNDLNHPKRKIRYVRDDYQLHGTNAPTAVLYVLPDSKPERIQWAVALGFKIRHV